MKKILLPTDFSENSWNAIAYAAKLFKDLECTFYLLNTYTPAIYHTEHAVVEPTQLDMGDIIKDNALKQLSLFKNKILNTFKNPKHSIEIIAAFNTLISEMKDIVKKQNIDYVVMGTKGATGIQEVLFGSNTVHAFKNVKCPIMAIPDNFNFEKPHEALFPTDYKIDYKDYHIKPIIGITSLLNTQVHVLHASYGYELSETQKKNKQKLEILFKKTPLLYHNVSGQTVQEAINHFQLKTKINMLIMVNNKHSFFENVFFKNTINQIGFHLNIPFLVIPSKH